MRTRLLSALFLAGLALPAVARGAERNPTAEPQRIGVVHFEKIFDDTERSRADRADLMKVMADRQVEVDRKKQGLGEARAQLERERPKMDALARARREAELDAEEGALRKLFQAAQEAVQAHERELSRKVVDDARAIAPGIGRARGVTVILGAAEALLWTAPDVVTVDLTAEVARALDARPHAASK